MGSPLAGVLAVRLRYYKDNQAGRPGAITESVGYRHRRTRLANDVFCLRPW
jgi:hypothetical protein